MIVADLAEPEKAKRAIEDGRLPLLVKLHGDFQSERLKNTSQELQSQDAMMRRNLVEACKRQGLAVVGYSGRDASIMEALEEAIDQGRGFPNGLFWFTRRDGPPSVQVEQLIERAVATGIEARLVEIESYNELMGDIVRYVPATAGQLASHPALTRSRLTGVTIRAEGKRLPVVRLTALPVVSLPTSCRLVNCKIGGNIEVRQAIANADVDIDAHRCQAGVIAFGRDVDIRKVFEPYQIDSLDTYALAPSRLRETSQQMALILDALGRALKKRPGVLIRRRHDMLIPNPAAATAAMFNSEPGSVHALGGTVPGTGVKWAEACRFRLDARLDRLWLLLEPRILVDLNDSTPDDHKEKAREFARERRAVRRNKAANSVLDGWISLIVGDDPSVRLKAFDISDGADAEFEISRFTAFSKY